ncbi:lipopolysaccharide biosynthesis protein RfbH [Desulfosporosinus sp. FKA]|uniref:lipopolysaccharide biosynthesis protein RfbH n=1 Tax=Desulfosporosinus sp. FKA TaxID=1969834 RepID=UPI000B497A50|nr:lipopolysaccharide biosynthesis protein RfbH [Desulfosporosinus sp. FKA]
MNELKSQILQLTRAYAEKYHIRKPFEKGDKVNYSGRVYSSEEMVNLVDSALEFWLTSGHFTDEFESKLAAYIGVKYCSFVNSGSSANLLAFMALTAPELEDRAIRRGDEVITVAAGFPTTIAPIVQFGAVPVFADVTIPQYNIDATQLENALGEKTKAVFVAHTLGNPFDIKAVKSFCDKHNLWLVEDNCDALGSEYALNGVTRRTGSFGDIGTSSFYPPHHITTGEGGAVYTDNPLLAKIVRSLRDWGRDCVCASGQDNLCGHRFDGQFGDLPHGYDHKYVYAHLGYNLKATDMQAAIGVAQLDKIDGFVAARRHNFARLRNVVSELSDKLILPEPCGNSNPSWFGFPLLCREGVNRERIVRCLEDNKIQTRMLFAGNIVRQPCMKGVDYRIVGSLDNTDSVMNNLFWVGVYPGMDNNAVDFIADTIISSVKHIK